MPNLKNGWGYGISEMQAIPELISEEALAIS
jgi:hypothetical protein